MKKLVVLHLLLAVASSVWARGGGGCFEEGTPVLTPHGEVPIERLCVGDEVIGGRVEAITQVEPDEYLELAGEVHVTAEHPFRVGPGVFRTAERCFPTARRIPATRPACNLLVSPGGTYIAKGYIVHNKGCFLPDTPILRADGSRVAISRVRPGDKLLAFDAEGAIVTGTVRQILTHEVDEYLIVRTDRVELRVTVEHPFYVGDGTFKTLEALQIGDFIYAFDGQGLGAQRIVSIERVRARTRVYNLQTDYPNTFFANGMAVHNKGGGCFLAGTLVRTAHGEVAIDTLRPGDTVLSGDGRETSVEATFVTRARLLTVVTDGGALRTTAEHPLLCADGRFRLAGELRRGDQLPGAMVVRCVPGNVELVYNLRVAAPHTFVAGGFVVHNKGGGGGFHGGGHYGGSRGGGGNLSPQDTKALLLFMAGAVVFLVLVMRAAKRREANENLDFCYPRTAIEPKANKTRKLLEFIAKTDSAFTPQALEQRATETFVKLQECWEARAYEPMKPLLLPDLYAQHWAQLQGLRRNHEINIIEDLHVDRVDIVNVRYTHKENEREFTALITASARDYYVDDRTQTFLRGDSASAQFQEFWTFQRQGGVWLLREIEQTRESDVLKDENFFEPFTETTVDKIYAEAAGGEGQTGPWLEKSVETKATRIERLLNFLVQTDKLWDRQTILERVREVFMRVQLALEARDVTALSSDDLFPETRKGLETWITQCLLDGRVVQYRNLCVRKVELVLVRNFSDNAQDEFVTRISAHAQRVITKNGAVLHQDEYVAPWEEYWTFGRLDGRWKLKEVLPPARGEESVGRENVDEDSSEAQLRWYYQHKRAT
ncbi:MAG TPA: TIM44-like domain-containing protein [Verrucomicrobiae bacterium]|nr:TIM44-like domain-containing protein [Verrucomicrobiae bacterium]